MRTPFAAASVQQIKAAEAEAEAIRKAGEAEAAVIRAKGLAEAERMQKKAEAWKHYSDAAYLEMLIASLPEVRLWPYLVQGRQRGLTSPRLLAALSVSARQLTAEIARPLRNTGKIVVVGNSDAVATTGDNKLTDDTTRALAQLPTVVQTLTGINMAEALRRIAGAPAPPPTA